MVSILRRFLKSASVYDAEKTSDSELKDFDQGRSRKRFYVEEENLDCLQTPPEKRRKDKEEGNTYNGFKYFQRPWSMSSFFSFVVGKDRVQRPDSNVLGHAAEMKSSHTSHARDAEHEVISIDDSDDDLRICSSGSKRANVRSPLHQISRAEILDLTLDDDLPCTQSELGSFRSSRLPRVVGSIEKSTSSRLAKPLSVNRAQNSGTSFLDEAVRMDERQRYRDLLAQFTRVNLPEYSQSLTPGQIQTPSRMAANVMNMSCVGSGVEEVSSWFPGPASRGGRSRAEIIDLTDDCSDVCPDPPKFYYQMLGRSASSSIMDSTFKTSNISSVERSESQSKSDILLGTEWLSKWRTVLDPVQLERDRQIAIEERNRKAAQEKQKDAVQKLKKERGGEFPELTEEMLRTIKRAWAPGNSSEKLIEGFGSPITRADIATLKESTWLNDEVVNFYFSLLAERSQSPGLPSVHAFNTFFYPKLMKMGHDGVKRWTKKVDVLSVDMILIPLHLGMHWCLAVIDFQAKQIAYFDSLKGNNSSCLQALKKYLDDESMEKKKVRFDFNGWSEVMPKDIPEQLNGCDCGVFMCKYAEYKSRRANFTFTQQDMPYFRKRMVYEILNKKLL